jgi:hypothetical protein
MKRIYHTWDKWECYPAGFYENRDKLGRDKDVCEELYRDFLRDPPRFREALQRVITEWKHSCEHYLTNQNMNRIAWLGQASACLAAGLPSCYRGGFNLLSDQEQQLADALALEYLNKWIVANGGDALTADDAKSRTQADLY